MFIFYFYHLTHKPLAAVKSILIKNLLFISILLLPYLQPKCSHAVNYNNFVSSPKYASLIVNAENGKVVYAQNAKMTRYPASLVKVMTLYIAFDEIKRGRLRPNQRIKVSKYAASQPRTNLNLKAGTTIKVEEAIMGMIVRSANDAAVAIAEAISGSEEKFAKLMNAKAKLLNMKDTVFCNASGLPDRNQVTTAHDIAILALAIQRNHSQFYHLFSNTSFKFGNQIIKTHNHILRKNDWVNGMKTGYINDSGFNIITTTKRPEGKLIAVVMGGNTAASRDNHTVELIETAYQTLSTKTQNPILVASYKNQNTNHSGHKKPLRLLSKKSNNTANKVQVLAKKPDVFKVLDKS